MTLEGFQRETLVEKNRRLRQEKCRHEEIYSSIIVTPFKRVGLASASTAQKPRFQEKCAMKDLPHEKQKLLDDSLGVATHRVALKVLETPREGTGGGLRDHARGAETHCDHRACAARHGRPIYDLAARAGRHNRAQRRGAGAAAHSELVGLTTTSCEYRASSSQWSLHTGLPSRIRASLSL
jgi:hypothetical protein